MRWPKIQLLILAALCICLAKADVSSLDVDVDGLFLFSFFFQDFEIPDDIDLEEFDENDEELLRLIEEKHVVSGPYGRLDPLNSFSAENFFISIFRRNRTMIWLMKMNMLLQLQLNWQKRK